MTVADLIEALRQLPPDLRVVTFGGKHDQVADADAPEVIHITEALSVFGNYRVSRSGEGAKAVLI